MGAVVMLRGEVGGHVGGSCNDGEDTVLVGSV